MSHESVREKLKKLLVDQMQFPLDPSEIREDTFLAGRGLALSSVDLVTLVIKLEDAFEVFLDEEELTPAITSFGTLATAIEQKLRDKYDDDSD